MPNPSIKDEKLYRGVSAAYEAWTVAELRKRAKELGLTGYSGLHKEDLIHKLRSH